MMDYGKSTLNVITPVALAYPDNSLPGDQPEVSPPIYYPTYPDNSLPGDQPRPDNSLPGDQPEVDNSLPGDQPEVGVPEFPTNPIVIPPGGELPELDSPVEVRVGWTEETGWVVVLIPTGEHVTPSKRR